MITTKRKLFFREGGRGRRQQITKTPPPPVPAVLGRVPRVSRLMALAIRFEGLLRAGAVCDQSDLARLAHVSQPRMTQIMNLLHLAPDIQEELLFLPRVTDGRDTIHEKLLRPIAAEVDWAKQRVAWLEVRAMASAAR
jgi:DNA-binding transcriptional regulator YdaS (Cro superfamily)